MEILIFNIYTYYLLVKEQLIFMSSIIEIHSDTLFSFNLIQCSELLHKLMGF